VGSSVLLDLFPSTRNDIHTSDTEGSTTNSRGMKSSHWSLSTPADDPATEPIILDGSGDQSQVYHYHGPQLSPSTRAQAMEIDFLGTSNKRKFSDYLSAWEQAQSSRHDWVENRLGSQEGGDKWLDHRQLDLSLTLNYPETIRKKQRVTSPELGTADESMDLPEEHIVRNSPQLDLSLALNYPSPLGQSAQDSVPSPAMEAENKKSGSILDDTGHEGASILDGTSHEVQRSSDTLIAVAEGSGGQAQVTLARNQNDSEPGEASEQALVKQRDSGASSSANKGGEKDLRISTGKRNAEVAGASEDQPQVKRARNKERLEISQEASTKVLDPDLSQSNSANKGKKKAFQIMTDKKNPAIGPDDHQTSPEMRVRNLSGPRERQEGLRIGKSKKMKTKSELRDLFHSPYTEKVWAWIYGGTTYLVEPIHQDFKRRRQSMTSEFVARLTSTTKPTIQLNSYSSGLVPINPIEFNENISDFVDLLFLTNMRLLRGFGTLDEVGYNQEHDLMQEWLLDILGNDTNKHSTSYQSYIEIFPGLRLKQVADTVFEALSWKKTAEVRYQLVKKINVIHAFVGVLSDRQLLMTKAIVTLLAAYYKLHNSTKWRLLFRDEGAFLSHMAKLQNPHMNCETQAIGKPKDFIEALELLPWKRTFTKIQQSTNRSFVLSLRPSSSSKWDDWVESFEEAVPPVFGNDVWATISLIEKGREPEIIAQDSQLLNLALRKFEFNQNNHLSSSPQLYDGKKLISFEQIKDFVRLVWVLNSRLIEAFGYKAQDPEYLEEQDRLQDKMFKILNHPPHREDFADNLVDDPKSDLARNERVISDMIFSSIMPQNTRKRYRPTFPTDETVTKREILMAKAAIKMIGHYYQERNTVKWYNFFKDEEGFINSFLRIGHRLHSTKSIKLFMAVNWEPMREMRLLPWSSILFTSAKQRHLYVRLFRRKQDAE
ncbi:hypothetical protein MJO28_007831, partial [Puccinia striiformis f. sp. tritici]